MCFLSTLNPELPPAHCLLCIQISSGRLGFMALPSQLTQWAKLFFFSQKAVGHIFTETYGVLWLLVSLLLTEKSPNNKLRVDFYKEKVWSFPFSPWGLQQPCEPGGSCCLALKRFKLRILSTEQAFIFLFSSVIYYLSLKVHRIIFRLTAASAAPTTKPCSLSWRFKENLCFLTVQMIFQCFSQFFTLSGSMEICLFCV